MILFQGQVYKDSKQDELISKLYETALLTLKNKPLDPLTVINACDKLYKKVMNHDFDDIILPLLETFDISYPYFLDSAKNFSRRTTD